MLKKSWIKDQYKFVPENATYCGNQIFMVFRLFDDSWVFQRYIYSESKRIDAENEFFFMLEN